MLSGLVVRFHSARVYSLSRVAGLQQGLDGKPLLLLQVSKGLCIVLGPVRLDVIGCAGGPDGKVSCTRCVRYSAGRHGGHAAV